jgi:rare lipoprotein A (peptidoglycan hydrolase)
MILKSTGFWIGPYIMSGGKDMKKALFIWMSLIIMIIPCTAQQGRVSEGLGTWYNARNSALMASHPRLPFGTQLKVTNLENNKQVIVKIGGRIREDLGVLLDVASPAADQLQMNLSGWTRLRIEVMPRAAKTIVNRSTDRDLVQEGIAMRIDEGTQLTAGHSSLPAGSRIRITNLANGREAVATVTERIRASRTRIVEISDALGQRLGIDTFGNVRIESIPE